MGEVVLASSLEGAECLLVCLFRYRRYCRLLLFAVPNRFASQGVMHTFGHLSDMYPTSALISMSGCTRIRLQGSRSGALRRAMDASKDM